MDTRSLFVISEAGKLALKKTESDVVREVTNIPSIFSQAVKYRQ